MVINVLSYGTCLLLPVDVVSSGSVELLPVIATGTVAILGSVQDEDAPVGAYTDWAGIPYVDYSDVFYTDWT